MLSMTATISLACPSAVSSRPVAGVGAANGWAADSLVGASVYSKAGPPLVIVSSARAFVKAAFASGQFWKILRSRRRDFFGTINGCEA